MTKTIEYEEIIEYERPWLYPKQQEAIFNDKRYSIIEASTKAGKTIGCIAWLLEQALFGKQSQNFWWVAPIFPQAKIAFRRLKEGLPRNLYSANESELKITLLNGAVIWFKGADKPDSLYGEDVYAAVIDEASRVKENSWHAIRSTLTATKGKLRIIGNVKGRSSWYYLLARKAQAGNSEMFYTKITAYDAVEAGILDKEEIEDAKKLLPEHVFRELYLAEPADDGGNPFGIKAIENCVAPLSTKSPVCFGIDLAKSVDYTVVIGLDEDRAVCYIDRWQSTWGETKININKIVTSPALVDQTGVGNPIVEELARINQNIKGFTFTSQSKQNIMEGLAGAIQEGLIKFPEGVIKQELDVFEYQYTKNGGVKYSAPEGFHDDCVCALALANHHFGKPKQEFRIMRL